MKNVKKTNMFIFEPYNWSYCGGAIIVVADTFEKAVILAKESCENGDYEDDEEYEGIFSQEKDDFEKDSWDQWLLTEKFVVIDHREARVVVNNWNYS